jgi:hypothetical protein
MTARPKTKNDHSRTRQPTHLTTSTQYQDRSFGLFLVYAVVLILCLCLNASATGAEADTNRPVNSAILSSDDGGVHVRVSAKHFEYDTAEDLKSPRIRYSHGRGKVTFSYEDEGYESVAVAGNFNGWVPDRMKLDSLDGVWTLRINLEPGRYLYHFIVRDEDGEWEAIDPFNDSALRDPDHGWVSHFRIKKEPPFRYGRKTTNPYSRQEMEHIYGDNGIGIEYQRVDGLILYWSPGLYSRHAFGTSLRGMIGYGFKSEEWSASGTLAPIPIRPGSAILRTPWRPSFSRKIFVIITGVRDLPPS